MKATGIIRRVDDLGRIVIPKEIRKTLKIREGDPVEIFTDNQGQVILKKYSPIGEIGNFAKAYAEAMSQIAGHRVLVTDREKVIAVAGSGTKGFLGKCISPELEEIMENRTAVNSADRKKAVSIVNDETTGETQQIIYPILSERDVVGSVVIFEKEQGKELSDTENKIAGVAAAFLGRQMEG